MLTAFRLQEEDQNEEIFCCRQGISQVANSIGSLPKYLTFAGLPDVVDRTRR